MPRMVDLTGDTDDRMHEDCLFCPKPDKQTKWWHEDEVCLLINKPSGEPMVVLKRHTTEPTATEMAYMKGVAQSVCGDHEMDVVLGHVKNHWHGHIRPYERHPSEVLDPL